MDLSLGQLIVDLMIQRMLARTLMNLFPDFTEYDRHSHDQIVHLE